MHASARPSLSRSTGRPALLPAGLFLLVAGCGGLPRQADGTVRSPVAAPSPDAGRQEDVPDAIAKDLLDRHNATRAEHDLPPLSLSPDLSDAARGHVADMIAMGKIDHRGTDGSMPADRVERQGYPFRNVGENVAFGQEAAEEVMAVWMDSPGHRRNILGDYEQMGAARDEDADGRPFWCIVFATPIPRLDPARAAAELLDRINTLRSEAKLPRLQAVEPLSAVARDHARALADAGTLDPPGVSYLDLLHAAGLGYRRASLAVFAGQSRPSDVLASLDPDGDLLGDFDRLGVGYATAPDGQPYWSLIFLQSPGT